MAASTNQLSGPDLTRGVPLSELPDGEAFQGHALGESVLLVRHGDDVWAIGATCTHYGGPLVEGLVVADTVRCPWHHACFSLRTGEALHAPALRPVARWHVERRGERVFVMTKIEQAKEAVHIARTPAPLRPGSSDGPSSIVIVGAGAAGDAAADMLRRRGYSGRILLFGEDPAAPYDRPNLSKDYLAGTAPEEWIPLREPDYYKSIGVDFFPGVRVASIQPGEKKVVLEHGEEYSYDRLLLATGAVPVPLDVPGSKRPHVFYLRTLADSRAVISQSRSARSAVVIGASFIGMEVAASLRTRGLEVHVVAPGRLPMERVFGEKLGQFIQSLHEEHGVVFSLERTAEAITEDAVMLTGGGVLPADLVVIGVGVRPDVTLARDAGLEVDDGVVVNEFLETRSPEVFAAGDIARWQEPGGDRQLRVEHWVVAQRQGQVAARNMLGQREPFSAAPFFWSQHYEVPITYVGYVDGWDRVDIAGDVAARDCLLAYRRDGRTLAVAGIYRDRESLRAELALEAGDEATLRELVPDPTA